MQTKSIPQLRADMIAETERGVGELIHRADVKAEPSTNWPQRGTVWPKRATAPDNARPRVGNDQAPDIEDAVDDTADPAPSTPSRDIHAFKAKAGGE